MVARGRGLTSVFGGRIALVDNLMYHQDIRRALGLPRDVPPERLRVALPFAFIAPLINAMVMGGRRGVAEELTGPGAARLVNRFG